MLNLEITDGLWDPVVAKDMIHVLDPYNAENELWQ